MQHARGIAWGLMALAWLAQGCSGDDGGGSGGGSGPDAALAARDCYLGLQVPGITHTGFACSGTTSSSSVSGLKPDVLEPALTVSILLAQPPAIGELELTSLTISASEAGAMHTWDAPVDACLAIATASAEEPDFDWTYYRIDISCSEPAVSRSGDSEPLTVGDFTIVTFFAA